MSALGDYKLVQLPNGTHTVYSERYAEKMHPGLGPAAEAEALYLRQLRIRERMLGQLGEFVVWDVGLGAAANALTLLHLTRDLACPLRIVSFDNTVAPLEFALAHAELLGYFHEFAGCVGELIAARKVAFSMGPRRVHWELQLGDFPSWCAQAEVVGAPDAIFYDAFSPAKNPAMWTLPLLTSLFRLLEPQRPCSLTTYSRSTMLRVSLLLTGFFVGKGRPTGLKEETTVAANSLSLLDEPLDFRWLERARRSDCAEPLIEPAYRRAPISSASAARLQMHPQFSWRSPSVKC